LGRALLKKAMKRALWSVYLLANSLSTPLVFEWMKKVEYFTLFTSQVSRGLNKVYFFHDMSGNEKGGEFSTSGYSNTLVC